jgi:hypothetical protein
VDTKDEWLAQRWRRCNREIIAIDHKPDEEIRKTRPAESWYPSPYEYRFTIRSAWPLLNAGKHLFSEWPLAATTDQAAQMHQLTGRKGLHHMAGLQARGAPTIKLRPQSYCRGLRRQSTFGHFDRFNAQLGQRVHAVAGLSRRSRNRRNSRDHPRWSLDRRAMLLPRRVQEGIERRRNAAQANQDRRDGRNDPDDLARPGPRQPGSPKAARLPLFTSKAASLTAPAFCSRFMATRAISLLRRGSRAPEAACRFRNWRFTGQ